MLVWPDYSADMEKLENEGYGRTISLARVRTLAVALSYSLYGTHLLCLRLIWGVAAAFLGVYNIAQNLNIPLIIQPQLFGILSIASWSQVYSNHMRNVQGAYC